MADLSKMTDEELERIANSGQGSPASPSRSPSLISRAWDFINRDTSPIVNGQRAVSLDSLDNPANVLLALGAPGSGGAFGSAIRSGAKAASEQIRPLLSKWSPFMHPLKLAPDLLDAAKAVGRGALQGARDYQYDLLPKTARVVEPLDVPKPPDLTPMRDVRLPSGRVAGRPVMQPPPEMPPGMGRRPLWENLKPSAPEPVETPKPPDLWLPSGRVPGRPAFDTKTGEMLTPGTSEGHFEMPELKLTPEEMGIHGGVENTPILRPPEPHPPFAENAPFSPSRAGRQQTPQALSGSEPKGTAGNPKALKIAKRLKAALQEE